MSQKLSRRSFLKTVGAVAFAATAMSTLTACGDGSSTSGDGITMAVKNYRIGYSNIDNNKRYFYFVEAEFTNNNSSEYKLTNKQFSAKTAAGDLPFAYFRYIENEMNYLAPEVKKLAAKSTEKVFLWFETTEEVFNKQERVDLAVSRKDNSGKTTTFVIKANGEVVSQ